MWFDQFGRKNLPWQTNKSAYRVWIAEIMLQQTQVSTVIPYYQKFMQRFSSIQSLADAKQDQVLHYWSGLGYYARARNLHKAAQTICDEHGGVFPGHIDAVQRLPGVGKSTAGAILACSMGQCHPILDGNVKRVLCRYHAIEGYPGVKRIESELWEIADQHTPHERVDDYTQAIMDLGATLCTRSKPNCSACPLQASCQALATDKVKCLPTPKPRQKSRRHEFVTMLSLVNHNNECALVKRPSKGIWGGLWYPLEFTAAVDLADWCANNKLNMDEVKSLDAPIDHSFTHYDLTINPLYLRLSKQQYQSVNKADMMWFNLNADKPDQVGLAAPVSQIIKRLQTNL